jgi:hypothetical protein
MTTAKILVPNKEWLVTENQKKLGTISKDKKGYNFLCNGKSYPFKSLSEIKDSLGIAIFEESIKKIKALPINENGYFIYDIPCSSKPYDPIYDVKKKLPLFAKSSKSKSRYCAGYYVIKFRKGWVKSFCPKLITLERYPYYGPFKTENEMKFQLNKINKHEAT